MSGLVAREKYLKEKTKKFYNMLVRRNKEKQFVPLEEIE